jgi:hypothetical protein
VLPAHALVEAYSVLTRLPSGLAVPSRTAARVLSGRFPRAALRLDDPARQGLLERLAEAGISGGATYDALVGLQAQAHERLLLTLDERAGGTYERLGVAHRAIAG